MNHVIKRYPVQSLYQLLCMSDTAQLQLTSTDLSVSTNELPAVQSVACVTSAFVTTLCVHTLALIISITLVITSLTFINIYKTDKITGYY